MPKAHGSDASDIGLGHLDVLDYISAAQGIRAAVDTVVQDLVVQARAEGRTWAEVGAALGGVGRTAAHKRFSEAESALSQAESLPPFDESPELFAAHVHAVAQLLQTASTPEALHLASVAAERIWVYVVNGVTVMDAGGFSAAGAGEPLDTRIKYLHNRVTGTLDHVNRFIEAVDAEEYISGDKLLKILLKAKGALENAEDLIYDHHAWGELVAWFRKRPRAEEELFDDPVAYCRQVFFLILIAGWYLQLAGDHACSGAPDGDRIRLFFERVRRYLMTALTLMLRDDVLATFYPDHLAYLRRHHSAGEPGPGGPRSA
jgi:hypothetical protein